ncbi:MAG: SPOR domain-containing protein [Chitinispirillaceae bacterium]|nr:SPOR domain-containing protein [Chitinispirillaceae bacterium]
MVPGKIFITGMIVLALFAGCTKKKTDKDREFASSTKTATTPPPSATKDIFDEFYKEDTGAAAKKAKAAKPEPLVRSAAGSKPSFSENGRFVVQVSTLPSRSLADALVEKLNAKGYPAYVADVQNPTSALSGTFYRVRIGGFTGVTSARTFGENYLSADGYEFWVDNRSNDNIGLEGSGAASGGGSYYGNATQTPATYEPAPATEPPPPFESTPPTPPAPTAPEQPQQAAPPPTPPPPPPEPAKTSTESEWGSSDDW